MGNSLQDQLLKAGLVSEQKVRQARSNKRKQTKQGHKQASDEAARQAGERARREKLERDRELNRQRQEEAAQRAREHEIRQLILKNRIVREGGDLAYHFSDGSALKRLYVKKDQHAALVAGRLAIVRQDEFYELVPAELVERLRERGAEELVLVFNTPSETDAEADDPYAEFQVPDDLMW